MPYSTITMSSGIWYCMNAAARRICDRYYPWQNKNRNPLDAMSSEQALWACGLSSTEFTRDQWNRYGKPGGLSTGELDELWGRDG
jgi:hypothetical protein